MLGRSRRDWDDAGVATGRRRDWRAGASICAVTVSPRRDRGRRRDRDYSVMVRDIEAARRYLATRSDVQQSRIGMAGASIGANLAALAGRGRRRRRQRLALLSPSLDYRGLRIEAAVRKYGSRPMLLVVSDEDAYATPYGRGPEEGRRRDPRELLTLSGAGHGTTMLGRAPELRAGAGRLVPADATIVEGLHALKNPSSWVWRGVLLGLLGGWIIGCQQARRRRQPAPAPGAQARRAVGRRRRPTGPGREPGRAAQGAGRAQGSRMPRSRAQLGNLYFDSERFDEAVRWYLAALEIDPKDVECQHRSRDRLLLHQSARPGAGTVRAVAGDRSRGTRRRC